MNQSIKRPKGPNNDRASSSQSSAARGERQPMQLTRRFGVTRDTLAERRAYLRIDDDARALMTEFIPWAREQAAGVAREFYDWQFTFSPTRAFFERHAERKGLSSTTLRRHLEMTQADYFVGIFEGAEREWDESYFETRLRIGLRHVEIDLPFKWYVGAYAELQRIVGRRLRASVTDPERLWRVEAAMNAVINYDIQAVGDSFFLSTIESMGLEIATDHDEHSDHTDHLAEVKESVRTLMQQAQTIASKRLNDEVLEVEIRGEFGDAIREVVKALRDMLAQVSGGARQLAAASAELLTVSKTLGDDSERTASQAGVVSTAATEISTNVQTVAASSEEMTASIREIAKSASEATRVAAGAVKVAEATNATVAELGEQCVQADGAGSGQASTSEWSPLHSVWKLPSRSVRR